MREISVYLFLGFLESGKTKFIQETLEDPRMENGEKTMLLVCEEGEEEYDPHLFQVKNVAMVTLESAEELTEEISRRSPKSIMPREWSWNTTARGFCRNFSTLCPKIGL